MGATRRRPTVREPEQIPTVIIGAGQSGLSAGYYLAQRQLPFVILEANARVGDTWRKRWDSLRLFTPARFDGLVGMPFPASPHTFPTKDEMADYLEAYVARFALPVRTGATVDRLSRAGERFLVSTEAGAIEAEQVIVAMASYQRRRVPAFAAELDQHIVQLHSSEYRSPRQLRPGAVLIVGAGNSGAEIGVEVARHGHLTWLSGRDPGHIPFRIESAVTQRFLLRFLFRVVFHRVLSTSTPIGRKIRPRLLVHSGPLIRQKPSDLAAAGIQYAPRTTGARDGRPVLVDGRVLDVANVIWCTGFHPGFSWIDLPALAPDGEPLHERGIVPSVPGLYFVGLHFLYALSSTMIHGVARDARHVVDTVAARVHESQRVRERAAEVHRVA
ncbi:MAG: NAD(P)-binding domain-containing protein [Gemmatimonadaceae bacterium]|nr:NAD(P)-binding domain-containing protein [Gemmatimonadaceae bacterium]